MTIEWRRQPCTGTEGYRLTCTDGNGSKLSGRIVLEGLCCDEVVRNQFLAELVAAPWTAVFWECAPLSKATLESTFEAVVLPAPRLTLRPPEPQAFSEHYTENEDVAEFENLGGDARLIAPKPAVVDAGYPHLMEFLRKAPAAQQHRLLEKVAAVALRLAVTRTVWLSTSGLGVSWLHVRLDSTPKYYQHAPFRRLAQGT